MAEFSRHFGLPRRYEHFRSWLLDEGLGVEVQVRLESQDGSEGTAGGCEVWLSDPIWRRGSAGGGPRLLEHVRTPDAVAPVVLRLQAYLQGRRAKTVRHDHVRRV